MNHKKLLKFFAAAVVLCLALTGQAFTADTSQNIATRAAGVSVRGRVTSYLPGVSCTVQLRQGDVVRYSTASFPGSGAGLGTQEFIIPGVADGIYDLVITKPGHLNYTIRNIVVQGSDVDLTTNDNDLVSDITLVAGDINGDGCVDLKDLIVLTSSDNFGKSPVVTVFDNGAADNPEDLTGLDDFYYENTSTGIRITGVKDPTKTAYVVPGSVTSIANGAFCDCTNLINVTIPDSVTGIGERAFQGCSSLTSITIPDSVTSIGEGTFSYCTSLTSITIPDSVTSIGGATFAGCSNLTSVTIPDSVTSIGDCAFDGCTTLTSITYGGTKAQWEAITKGLDWDYNTGNYTITYKGEPTGLEDFYYGTTGSGIKITGVKDKTKTEYVIPEGVTSIGGSAFQNCSNLTSVSIPDGVTSIGDSAFQNCSNLTSVLIPDGVTSIGRFAFSYCTSLTSITIPNTVTSIENLAFFGCTSLTSITIPESVTIIRSQAFSACKVLQNIEVADTNEAYTSINGNLYTKNGKNLIRYAVGKTDTQFTVPDGVTHIGNDAFSGCSSLTSITIPESVTSIGDSAFQGCSSLTNIKYRGTQAQWAAITKGTDWDLGTGNYTITYNYTGE